ncbi:hypothetical protein CERZMDRAFT_71657 [Cercospora zeae-maydis SCOH1-5]|uniref:Peptidase S53 domain-containing protein n=1 Tax=Cercospora zeae-maydis SCOH1-5 TaxID=717836 RepID=A0A6A6F404_9PEZI|nr:hypothetical protein CERZMDRAFT_71657 [Cercospora zeae-maydis SCOH1-5]
MKVALKQSNLDQAEAWLNDVASPDSPNFGKFWTSEEVIEAFRPPTEAVNTVLDWLQASGIHRDNVTYSENKQWLVFDCTAEQAEGMLHTTYHEYHDLQGRSLMGTDAYHLPRDVSDIVDFVKPGVLATALRKRHAPSRRQQPSGQRPGSSKAGTMLRPRPGNSLDDVTTPESASNCTHEASPACLSTLLNMPFLDGQPTPDSPKSLGIFMNGLYYEQSDLDLFYEEFMPSRIPKGFGPEFVSIDGGATYAQTDAGGDGGSEPALDLELTIPFYYPGTVMNIQVDDVYYADENDPALLTPLLDAIDGSYCTSCAYGICGPFDPILDPAYPDKKATSNFPQELLYKGNYQCGTFKPPAVISSSWYSPLGEPDEHAKNHASRQCDEILKLGLQGVTFLFSSGDWGVGYEDTCEQFDYQYPNGCPWILVVGATMIGAGKTEHDVEVTWQTGPQGYQPYAKSFSSGAGFSMFFDRPSYQADVVEKYLAAHDQGYPYWEGLNYNHTKPGYYNRAGRAYPDVAANGGPVARWEFGTRKQDGGSSAAVQLMGVMLARIVDERRKVGKGGIGTPHQVLYSNPQVFRDVVSGNNPGCGTDGFPAVEGWDVPTGLGVPDYEKLLQLYLSLP